MTLDEEFDKAHDVAMRNAIFALAILVSGCSAPATDSAQLFDAVRDAVCADDREQLEAAISAVAQEARLEGEGVEDLVAQVAAGTECGEPIPPPPEGFTIED